MKTGIVITDSILAAIEAALPVDPQSYTIGDRQWGT